MTAFPQSAHFGRRIPVSKLKKQGLAPRFAEWIKSLVWAYKLSPDTVQLAATESVREIEVMDLVVKDSCSGTRSLASLIAAFDRIIPSPLIFRVFDEDGTPLKVAFNLKPSGGSLTGTSDVFRLFQTTADTALPEGVVNLESFFRNFAAAVAGMTTSPDETLKELDERHYRVESLRADLADLERKLSRETQFDRKYAQAKEKQALAKEIARLSCAGSVSRRDAEGGAKQEIGGLWKEKRRPGVKDRDAMTGIVTVVSPAEDAEKGGGGGMKGISPAEGAEDAEKGGGGGMKGISPAEGAEKGDRG